MSFPACGLESGMEVGGGGGESEMQYEWEGYNKA